MKHSQEEYWKPRFHAPPLRSHPDPPPTIQCSWYPHEGQCPYGGVLDIVPTLPLTADPSVFKGEKPESILFPDGREIKTPTWKAAVLAIMQDCNTDANMHSQLMELRGKVLGRQRAILAASPEKMHAPLEIAKDLYMESYYDTGTLLYVLKNRVLDEVGYNYSGIRVQFRQEQVQEQTQEEVHEQTSSMDEMSL